MHYLYIDHKSTVVFNLTWSNATLINVGLIFMTWFVLEDCQLDGGQNSDLQEKYAFLSDHDCFKSYYLSFDIFKYRSKTISVFNIHTRPVFRAYGGSTVSDMIPLQSS